MVYRILKDKGYEYRIRIYDIEFIQCGKRFDKAKQMKDLAEHEILFLDGSMFNEQNVEDIGFHDFKIDTSSSILALNMHNGNLITFSADPDIYKFRVLKYFENERKWKDF